MRNPHRNRIIATWIFVAIAVAWSAVMVLTGCSSTPTPDPDNGVSNASYRIVITQSDKNIQGVLKRLRLAEISDLASVKPVHTRDWWDAQVTVVAATEDLLESTLRGATYTASPTK